MVQTRKIIVVLSACAVAFLCGAEARSTHLSAGIAKADISDYAAGPVHDPLHVKVLALNDGRQSVALVTLDVVAVAEIGRIKNDFLPAVRDAIHQDLKIPASHLIITASHCHGTPSPDTTKLTIATIKAAFSNMVEVQVGAGLGHEERIMENRRLLLKSGAESDSRRAYPLVPGGEIVSSGAVDPAIALLRIDRLDGTPLAALYTFACHPIMDAPDGGNTADYPGFASALIEEGLGHGAMAFFMQGCAGDINPAMYRLVQHPRDGETLGNLLGLSALRALRQIRTRPTPTLQLINETIQLPRGTDLAERIARMEQEQLRLLNSFKGTDINLESFIPLYVQYTLNTDHPSYYAYRYLDEAKSGRRHLARLDKDNRVRMGRYLDNIAVMEELLRLKENLRLLKKHLAANQKDGSNTIDANLTALKIGDFTLATFPGEPSAQVGLNIKARSTHPVTAVCGYTNGYIYYAPTASQRRNTGYAQEDCDCLLAPEWQDIFEAKALEMLSRLQ